MLIQVLQKPSNGISNRSGKTQKKGDWEAELRAELEKKKGLGTKLSVKDQALVNEQIAKETGIRSKVEEARQIVSSGLGIVQSLIDIPANLGAELWFYKVLKILLGGVVQKCGDFVGGKAVETFLVMKSGILSLTCRICQNLLLRDWDCLRYLLALHCYET